ncbi:MAG: hypothetical protein FWE31_04695 [Firmicutes bacterium]|nr:hypothetical protein [Bacillota bacterium]
MNKRSKIIVACFGAGMLVIALVIAGFAIPRAETYNFSSVRGGGAEIKELARHLSISLEGKRVKINGIEVILGDNPEAQKMIKSLVGDALDSITYERDGKYLKLYIKGLSSDPNFAEPVEDVIARFLPLITGKVEVLTFQITNEVGSKLLCVRINYGAEIVEINFSR